ncbi:MAG: SAM-dependent methyltransferase [Candidatus Nanopelagicales bacterium]
MAEPNPDSRWAQWHRAYGDPQSALTNRLEAVRSRIRQGLEARRDGPIRLISVCSGQGNDVVGALKEHPQAAAVTGRLFEWDSYNCEVARVALNDAGLKGIEVVQADASYTTVCEDSVPADVVLLCGIFGNVSDEDVHNTVRNTSRLCAGDLDSSPQGARSHSANPKLVPSQRLRRDRFRLSSRRVVRRGDA